MAHSRLKACGRGLRIATLLLVATLVLLAAGGGRGATYQRMGPKHSRSGPTSAAYLQSAIPANSGLPSKASGNSQIQSSRGRKAAQGTRGARQRSRGAISDGPPSQYEWSWLQLGLSHDEPGQMHLWRQLNSAYVVMDELIAGGEDPFHQEGGFSPSAWAEINRAVNEALGILESHPELNFREHPHLQACFWKQNPTGAGRNEWRDSQVPVAVHLYRMYMGFRLDPARQLLLNLLERGLDAGTTSPLLIHSPTLLMSDLGQNKLDLQMLRALVAANATLRPAVLDGDHTSGVERPETPATGVSLMHTFATQVETTLLKKFLMIGDEMSSIDMEFVQDTLPDFDIVSDVYRRLARSPRATSRADWAGHLFNVEYATLRAASPTFRALCKDWNAHGPAESLDRTLTVSVNEELMLAVMDVLVRGGLDVREVALQLVPHLNNYFHVVVLKHQRRLTGYMLDNFFGIIEGDDSEGITPLDSVTGVANVSSKAGNFAQVLLRSLGQREYYLQRTPLHVAAAVYGDEEMYHQLLGAEARLLKWLEARNLFDPEDLASRTPSNMRDALGNLAADYITGTANRTIPSHLTLGEQKAETVNLFSDSHALDVLRSNSTSGTANSGPDAAMEDNAREVDAEIAAGVDINDPTATTTGGWEVYGSRPDLEAEFEAVVDPVSGEITAYKEACDIQELFHMPTKAEFASLILAGRPFVIRNGAEHMGLKRYLWTRKNFLAQFGDSRALVTKIPYQKSFTSFLKQEKAMHSSRWKQSHLVDAGDAVRAVGLLSERQQAELEKIPIREYLRSFNQSDATGIPNYLFSTAFVSENPSIVKTVAPAFDWSMDIHGIGIVFEGQFYLGPPGSGAPAHWHGAAMNVMAYGRKRWVLTPPFEGTFYSVKPSMDFFQHDLPVLLNQSDATGSPTTILNFTQHSGDIVVLPREWGHRFVVWAVQFAARQKVLQQVVEISALLCSLILRFACDY
eukprot:INCI9363.4.p1 GENE.INCI9363.4~~INCI9363.4.p1  ORF type:complete len:970 (-),score=170.10 INCI9363.4:274-3183(-)